MNTALFDSGVVVATPGVQRLWKEHRCTIVAGLCWHMLGNWGDVSVADRTRNDHALVTGERLLSAYPITDDLRIYVITEADRSATTLLLPSEY